MQLKVNKKKKVSKYFLLNDIVQIISGKEKGKIGTIKKIDNKRSLLVVEGINLRKKHSKSKDSSTIGQIIQFESPISASNVMLYDKNTNKCIKPAYKREHEKTVRINKKNGTVISTINK
uniref:Large ribosomal subunit protein uL24c n=1 Tax=Compsopogon caeruleus TaxID=31354 RepID=A0A1Z1XB87_9RHOD|nr:50S ribosomal protein L24 [Compsopogon caeruleus]ARX96088.1 50S ribosomal protein L24 [Compsopogon caeruleus]